MANSAEVLHPVRLRILQMLLADGEMTTNQLHARLQDVPIATLYRHTARLVDSGLVEVASEQQIRGASERTYRVTAALANPSASDLQAMSGPELSGVFTAFVSGLLGDFETYLGEGEPDLVRDRVNFAQASFWATTQEVDRFTAALMAALEDLLANEPGSGRRKRTLSTVLIPRRDSEED